MSDLAISALPIAGAISGAELIPLVQTGTTCQSTASALLTYISGSLTATNGLTKTGNNIVWGGALTGNTTISGAYSVNFSNSFIGINTATQSAYSERLRVNGPTRFDDTVYVSDQGYFTWSPGTSFNITALTQHLYLSTSAVKDIVIIANGSEVARAFSSGEFSVGYGVSASAKLQVAGSTTDSSAYAFKVFDSALSQIIGVRNDGYTYFSRLTASTVPYIDASNRLVSSAVTPTELGLLSGLTGFTGTGTLLAKGTSPVFTTDITSPLIIGGSAVGSQLTLKGTSANGTSTVAAIVGNVGNNGATNAFNVYNSGQFNIGNYASPTNLRIFTVGQDTAYMSLGSLVGTTSSPAIYMNVGTPSALNYTLSSDGLNVFLNGQSSAGGFYFRTNGTNRMYFAANLGYVLNTIANSSGAIPDFTFTGSSHTGQTASTEINGVKWTTSSRQWNTGAITTQREVYITSPTYSFVGASTISSAYTLYVAKPTAGSNATITNRIGIGTDGIVEALTFKLTTYNDIVFDHTGIGIIGNQFSTNGGLALASRTSGTAIGFLVGGTAGTEIARIDTNGMTFVDAKNIIFNTTTGTKIGTGTTQKIGFWNATPIVQPTTAVAAATFVANTSGIVDDTATFDGYTIGQVVKALRNTGILA